MAGEHWAQRAVERLSLCAPRHAPVLQGARRVATARRLRDVLGGVSVDMVVSAIGEFETLGCDRFELSTMDRLAGFLSEKGCGTEEWPWLKSAALVSLCGHGLSTARLKKLASKVKDVESIFERGGCALLVVVLQCMYREGEFLSIRQVEEAHEMLKRVGDTETSRLMEAMVYSVTRTAERSGEMEWTNTSELQDYEEECVKLGEEDEIYFAARGGTDPYEGWGVCGSNDGGVFYRGEFSGGQPHGTCTLFDIEEKDAVFCGRVVNGEPCGRGELRDKKTGSVACGMFDANCNILDGKVGVDMDERPGYQKFTLRFIASEGPHNGMYAMDTGMGDTSYCDPSEALEYTRAAEASARAARIMTTKAVIKRAPVEPRRKTRTRARGAQRQVKKDNGSQQTSARSKRASAGGVKKMSSRERYEKNIAKANSKKSDAYDLGWLENQFDQKTDEEVDALLTQHKVDKKYIPGGFWYYLTFRMWVKAIPVTTGNVMHDDVLAMCKKAMPRLCEFFKDHELRNNLKQTGRFPDPDTKSYDMHVMECYIHDLRGQPFFKYLHMV